MSELPAYLSNDSNRGREMMPDVLREDCEPADDPAFCRVHGRWLGYCLNELKRGVASVGRA